MSGPALGKETVVGLETSEAPPAQRFSPVAPGSVVLVEATDRDAAYAIFQEISAQPESAAHKLVHLAPGLIFARVQPTGRYWVFDTLPGRQVRRS